VLTRRTFAIAAAAFAAFAIYGSLVPLEYRALTFDAALAKFSTIRYLELGIQSRADFVANILLFIPLGVLLAGACLADRRGRLRQAMTAFVTVPLMSALSVAIEFTQVFFPRRTMSLNDIAAETVGGAIGVGLWMLYGQSITNWIRAFTRERQRPQLVVRLLSAYALMFVIAQLMPFDVTIDVGELAQKFHEGRIVLTPFAYAYPSLLAAVWDLGSDVALWIPIGALACIGWTRPGIRRSPVNAVALGVFCACLIELAQIFVFSRYAALPDLFTAAAGVSCGVMVSGFSATLASPVAPRSRHRVCPVGALLVWIAALVTYHWAPFDFVISGEALREGVARLWVPPFSNYYVGSEFHAFTELTRKFLLAAPVGVLLRLAVPAAASVSIARLQRAGFITAGVILFSILEAGQMFLPARTADLIDVVIGVAAVEAGRWIVDLLRDSAETAVDGVGYARR
jgi:VanZ family protein